MAGDRLMALRALRDRLAAELDRERLYSKDVAPLAKALADVLREIDSLAPPKREKDGVDEIAQRRARRKAAADPDVPARTNVRRPRGG